MDTEILKYLKNIANKLIRLDIKFKQLEAKIMSLGKCNSEAFKMCKITITALAENQEEVYNELMESAGKIQECSWN